ncbi:putative reverse transcriptase domain-containing protein [Tanacetum coccineum]
MAATKKVMGDPAGIWKPMTVLSVRPAADGTVAASGSELASSMEIIHRALFAEDRTWKISLVKNNEEEKRIAEEQAAKDRYWKILICYDDDEDYTIAITPVLPNKKPVNSLSMGDDHLDTIPATESDEVIKSSVENLVPILSESEGIPDNVCDVPLCNNPTPLEAFKEHSETIIDSNNDSSSSDDDSYENIDYVDASPPDAEIVSLEVVEIVIPEVGGIDTDILLTIKDDILREKLLNVNLLIANIEALKDNPTLSFNVMTKSSSTSLGTTPGVNVSEYSEVFLSQIGDEDGRGVKEKNGVAPSAEEKNEAVKDGVTPSVTVASGNSTGTQEANSVKADHDNLHDENVEETPSNVPANPNKVISKGFVNIAYGFFLVKRVAYPVVANYFSYVDDLDPMLDNGPWFIRNNPLILKKWDPSEDGLSAIATKLGTPLMLHYYTYDICMESWGRSSYARSMIELWADVELKDTIMVDMPKIVGKGFYTCTIRVEYEWKHPRCACCKVFSHIKDECSKNLDSDVAKKSKISSQAPKGVPVGPKVGFKPTKQLYTPVSKKNNVNTSGNKKNDVESTKEIKRLIIDGKVTLVDDEGKPLENVDSSGDHDSEDEVASVDNEMVIFLTSKKVGYGTNSLLEQ